MAAGLMSLLKIKNTPNEGLPSAALNETPAAFWQRDLNPLLIEKTIAIQKAQILYFFVCDYEVCGLQYLGELCREWAIYPLPIITNSCNEIDKIAETDLSDVLISCSFGEIRYLPKLCAYIPKGFRSYLTIPDLENSQKMNALKMAKGLGLSCFIEM